MGVNASIDVQTKDLKILRNLLNKYLPNTQVWAFGSRVKWASRTDSDLDLVVFSTAEQNRQVHDLIEAMQESSLPFRVDVLVWDKIPDSFRDNIKQQYFVLVDVDAKKGGVMSSCQTFKLGEVVTTDIADANVGLRYANPTYAADWENTTLGEICSSQGGAINTGPFGSQLHTSDYKEQGIPVVMPTNIGEGGIVEDQIARISEDDAQRLGRHRLNVGDIVFSRRGDVTKNALIRSQEAGWLCGTGCLKVALGTQTKADARFISYYLRLPEIKNWLIRHAVGATMPNLNTGILSAVPVVLPPIPDQLEIAETLGALDDRIALLRETNATLEAIAQALFKSWFVDFDPVHAKQQGREPEGMDSDTAALFPASFEESELGLIPSGWQVDNIYVAAQLIYGAPFASSKFNSNGIGKPLIRIRDLKKEAPGIFTTEVHPKGYLVKPGDIVVGMDGEFRAYLWGGEEAWLNQRVCVFVPNKRFPVTFVHRSIMPILAAVEASETATTVIHLGKNDIDRFRIVIPDEAVLKSFEEITDPLYKRIVEQKQTSRTLTTLRDTLLPRLISGQLRLPEAVGRVSLQGVTRQIEANMSDNA